MKIEDPRTRHNCNSCMLRSRYDAAPGSLLGRLWRWHIKWCPGWKRFLATLPAEEQKQVIDQYSLGN